MQVFCTVLIFLLSFAVQCEAFSFAPMRSALLSKAPRSRVNVKMLLSSTLLPSLSSSALPLISLPLNSFLISEESTYSSLSLYFTLALYVLTLPGHTYQVTNTPKHHAHPL